MAEDEKESLEAKGQAPNGGREEELPPPPVFTLETPPTTGKKMDMIKWGLMHGKSEEELVDIGFNKKTVSMAAYDLERDGWRDRPRKGRVKKDVTPKASNGGGAGTKAVTSYATKALSGQTKSLPPEFLIDNIHLPMDGSGVKNFEAGLKFGASMLVLGVRVAQELSNMGMQQVNPVIAMANAMRAGEAAAAKDAAAEAAIMAAEEVKDGMMPILAGLHKETAAASDPMKQMVTNMFQPMLQRLLGTIMPGVGGTGNMPQGWTRRTVEE